MTDRQAAAFGWALVFAFGAGFLTASVIGMAAYGMPIWFGMIGVVGIALGAFGVIKVSE